MRHSGRIFVVLIVAVVLAAVWFVRQDGKEPKVIGVVNIIPDLETLFFGFKQGMEERGYKEGIDVVYLYDGPVGVKSQDLARLVERYRDQKVDLILSLGTPSGVAVKQTLQDRDIPVVFMMNDPVAAKVIDDLRAPGGMMTGIRAAPLDEKRLEWFSRILPEARNILVPYNPNDPSPSSTLQRIKDAAAILHLNIVERPVINRGALQQLFDDLPTYQDIDGIFLLPDGLLLSEYPTFERLALEINMPLSGPSTGVLGDGVLLGYGQDHYESGRQVLARLATQIFSGRKAGELPVETPEPFMMINLRTAQKIGIEVPTSVLNHAHEIVR